MRVTLDSINEDLKQIGQTEKKIFEIINTFTEQDPTKLAALGSLLSNAQVLIEFQGRQGQFSSIPQEIIDALSPAINKILDQPVTINEEGVSIELREDPGWDKDKDINPNTMALDGAVPTWRTFNSSTKYKATFCIGSSGNNTCFTSKATPGKNTWVVGHDGQTGLVTKLQKYLNEEAVGGDNKINHGAAGCQAYNDFESSCKNGVSFHARIPEFDNSPTTHNGFFTLSADGSTMQDHHLGAPVSKQVHDDTNSVFKNLGWI